MSRSSPNREPRLVARCKVEFERPSGAVTCETEDISQRGIFVRTDEVLPVGAVSALALTLPSGTTLRFLARVAHLLMPAAAKALGRHVGIGFELMGKGPEFETLRGYVNTLKAESTNPGLSTATLAMLAEPSGPLRARISRVLERAGYEVRTYDGAAEALAAASGWRPDVVIAAMEMDDMTGVDLAYAMGDHATMSSVPLVLTGESVSDMLRLEAYRAGVRDFVPQPFLDEEFIIRVHRVASAPSTGGDLRGTMQQVGLASLLSMFEFERKTGVLLVISGPEAARLFVCDGRIVKVEGGGHGAVRARLNRILDWTTGQFEFSAVPVEVDDELGTTITNILLAHAQAKDEATS